MNITVIEAGQATKTVRESIQAQIVSRFSSFTVNTELLIVDNLIANLPTRDIDISDCNIPPGFALADPLFNKASPVILGARHYHTFFENATQFRPAPHQPVMIDSVFGWVMTGHTPKSITYKGATSANTNEMCNLFADRFADCFSPAINDTDTIDAALVNNIAPAGINMSTPFIDSEIVLSALTQLKPFFAPGLDGIPSIVLKRCQTTVAPILAKLFNASLANGYFPKTTHCIHFRIEKR